MRKISINMDEQILEQIKKVAKEMGINVSTFIRVACAEKLKRERE